MFQYPFSFDGRIRRTEYGLTFLIIFGINVASLILVFVLGGTGAIILRALLSIPIVWFLWAQGAKRCHDMGRSGWFQIIPFFFIVMIFAEGDRGGNGYGEDPKDSGHVPVNQLNSETLDGHLRNDSL